MRGRASGGLRSLAIVTLATVTWTGAALAAPVDVLRISDGRGECAGALPDGAPFRYEYIQSIYHAPVIEELERHGDRIRMVRARSTDIRAVEYFRWEGEIHHDPTGYAQDAPFYETERLLIRISPEYLQRVAGGGWSCDLAGLFGDGLVTVEPAVRPALATR